jgi:hypothetical protein
LKRPGKLPGLLRLVLTRVLYGLGKAGFTLMSGFARRHDGFSDIVFFIDADDYIAIRQLTNL